MDMSSFIGVPEWLVESITAFTIFAGRESSDGTRRCCYNTIPSFNNSVIWPCLHKTRQHSKQELKSFVLADLCGFCIIEYTSPLIAIHSRGTTFPISSNNLAIPSKLHWYRRGIDKLDKTRDN